ncbi:mammalian cell entry protein [Mycolicibacterium moriokaense]|uniref:Mammalian cell entry protein n=1 Tax=Mycolicibacterium moriokaense TaxID=39691 RepID=A0AAD1M8J3_9MYCO|nr:MlaD family protein [Mycolicibacterium moriokaense]MCV7038785.1 MCE family protein [Mycolicibacterium moriokaense]ORB25383.1 mammalian cell entry protein [Mycolicibacterium moriokaense]BBX03604.1 mammalian cell entry protein [Mycolicibacterium moriokaense]
MRMTKRVKVQLSIFATVAVTAGSVMIFGYIKAPAMFGVGRYTVTMQLTQAAGLYESANVTYRGTEVGRVTAVTLTDTGVDATLSLRSDVKIPSDLTAEVHSTSAIGEQYVALLPRSGNAPPLKNGDVIPVGDTSIPPDIGALLDAANRQLLAIPRDNVKTVIDESYVAVGGQGPEISRIVNGSTQLAIDARKNLDPMVSLIDQSQPVLDSQAETADSIKAWASHLADLTGQLKTNDSAFAGLIERGGHAADEARQLIDRLQPSVPVLMNNLLGVGQLALTYNPAIEQLLVLVPMGVAVMQAGTVANQNTKHPGLVLSFNLNLNLPPPCTTGYLPAQQQRIPTMVDTPDRPVDDLYCRIPQNSWNAVRGARNLPCLMKPGKRAPSAKMCKSDEEYVPLNDGFNWKGDPNATLSGQDIPQRPPEPSPPQAVPAAPPEATPPIAAAYYDPATGSYEGPDGRIYTQSNLAPNNGGKTWQDLLTPPS